MQMSRDFLAAVVQILRCTLHCPDCQSPRQMTVECPTLHFCLNLRRPAQKTTKKELELIKVSNKRLQRLVI